MCRFQALVIYEASPLLHNQESNDRPQTIDVCTITIARVRSRSNLAAGEDCPAVFVDPPFDVEAQAHREEH